MENTVIAIGGFILVLVAVSIVQLVYVPATTDITCTFEDGTQVEYQYIHPQTASPEIIVTPSGRSSIVYTDINRLQQLDYVGFATCERVD